MAKPGSFRLGKSLYYPKIKSISISYFMRKIDVFFGTFFAPICAEPQCPKTIRHSSKRYLATNAFDVRTYCPKKDFPSDLGLPPFGFELTCMMTPAW